MAQPQRKPSRESQESSRPKLQSIKGGGDSTDRSRDHLSLAAPGVYDPDSEAPMTGPNLQVLQGGGETSAPSTGHLTPVDDDDGDEDSSGVKDSESKGAKPEKTGAESSESAALGGDDASDSGASGKTEGGGNAKAKGLSKSKKLIGGGAAGGIIGGVIFLIVSLVPTKLITMVENLQDRFFASSNSAIQTRSEVLMSNYIRNHVLPSLGTGTCGTTTRVNSSCVAPTPGANMAQRLYNTWRDANLEGKLANKYGIAFERNPSAPAGQQYLLRVRGSDTPFDLEGWRQQPNSNLFVAVGSRNDIRNQMRVAFSNETRWKKVMYRFKVGRLLERKYGIRRCIFACDARDRFDDWGQDKRKAAKLAIVRRVVEPHSEFVGYALSCILSGECNDSPARDDGSSDHDRRDSLERRIKSYLESRSIAYTQDTIQSLLRLIPEMNNLINVGLTNYLVEKILLPFMSEQAAKKAVPIVGWIDLASSIIKTMAEAGPKLRRWAFAINTTAAISFWMMQATSADEMKAGNVDPEILGGMVDVFGPDAGDRNHQNQPAEISPLWSEYIQGTGVTSMADIFSPKAYADIEDYKCDDGDPIDEGKVVCPEERFILDSIFIKFSEAFATAPLNAVKTASDFWEASGGEILDLLNGLLSFVGPAVDEILSRIPGISTLKDQFTEWTGSLLQNIAEWVIPSVISPDMSGGRAFHAMASGADAAGFAFGTSIGAGVIPTATYNDIDEDQQNQAKEQFASQSFTYRMFSTENTRSLVSQLSLSVGNPAKMGQGWFSSLISNPISKLTKGFGSFFARPRTFAALNGDPFGVPQVGIALNDPILRMDPDILTPEYCDSLNDLWAENDVQVNPATGAIISQTPLGEGDPETGVDLHHYPNPCLLEESTVGAAGGFFNTDLLGDDVEDPPPSNVSAPTPSPGVTPPSGAQMAWPLNGLGRISACWREDRTGGTDGRAGYYHSGIDIAAADGAPILAAADGTVVLIKTTSSGTDTGLTIIVQHPGGLYTQYQHIKTGTIAVTLNQAVSRGQTIAQVDSTGFSFGSHLHFNVQTSGVISTRVNQGTLNPLDYLPNDGRPNTYVRGTTFASPPLSGATVRCVPSSQSPNGWITVPVNGGPS